MSDFLNPYVRKPAIRWVAGTPLPDMEREGVAAPLLVDATTGALIVTGGGGGGGSTDMSVTNGILTTTAADTAIIKDEALSIDNKLPALTGGRIPVVSETPVTEATFTQAGAIAINTVLIGPLDVSQFRTVSVQVASFAAQIAAEISNNNATWTLVAGQQTTGSPASITNPIVSAGTFYYQTYGAMFFRLRLQAAQSSGTTTIAAQAIKEVYPQNLQTVSGMVQLNGGSSTPVPFNILGFNLYHTLISGASTNATSVKTGQGCIGTLILTNTSSDWAYFKLVNKSSAPTVGTDTAIINIGVAPNSTLDCSTAFAGLRMTAGIAYYVSAGTSLTDNTALPVAGTFLVNMTFV
jgi:hypothetical protein